MSKSERLDTILIRRGWVTESQAFQALMEQERLGHPFGSTLVLLGFISERQLAEALAEQFGTPAWDPETAVVELAALELFSEDYVREHGFLPLAYDEKTNQLEIAIADPTNRDRLEEIRTRAGVDSLVVATAPSVSLARLWNHFYREPRPSRSPLPPIERGEPINVSGPVPQSQPRESATPTDKLGLEFSFSIDRPESLTEEEHPHASRVLLWLSQPFVTKLLKSLLEIERCLVAAWDGGDIPAGEWNYVVYDQDSLAACPDGLARLKRHHPQIQPVLRPSLTTAVLRSPLSYERMRDGYIHLSEYMHTLAPQKPRDRRVARYALAVARLLPLSEFEIDTLMVACELAPILQEDEAGFTNWDAIAENLRCPFPVLDILKAAPLPFSKCNAKPGQSSAESPLSARVLSLVTSFLLAAEHTTPKSIDDLSRLTDWLRQDAGERFDPVTVEALLRVLREEVLEGCLPPGPSEVVLVSDQPVEWSHLSMQLENDGWRVVTANGAAEARKLVERRKPNAVVWAAAGAVEWIRWLNEVAPGVSCFLVLEEQNQPLARAALEAGYEDVWTGSWDTGVAVAKLTRAVSRKPQAEADEGMVTGSLEQLSFIDLIQILTAGGRSVSIDIKSDKRQGRVSLWRGQIKFAMSGDTEGEEAVYDIITWNTGSFTLRPIDAMPSVNVRLPNDALLLEGCRLLDERQRAAIAE
ncbi:MAG: hypothetical protein Kow0074_02960 [Candidatus Zixiibacteriota bacterium]